MIRLGGCPGWSESSLGAQSLCMFCHVAAQMSLSLRCLFWKKYDIFPLKNICCIYLSVHSALLSRNDYVQFVRLKSPRWYDLIENWRKSSFGPRQANLVLIAYASSEGSGKPAHLCSLARTSAARSYKQWVKRNLQTESQIPSPSEWLGMRS